MVKVQDSGDFSSYIFTSFPQYSFEEIQGLFDIWKQEDIFIFSDEYPRYYLIVKLCWESFKPKDLNLKTAI